MLASSYSCRECDAARGRGRLVTRVFAGLLRFSAVALAFVILGFSGKAVAGTVPVSVKLDFVRAQGGSDSVDGKDAVDKGDAWIFVLDHSGSMTEEDATVNPELAPTEARTQMRRWDALLVALRATLEQIDAGSIVEIVKVGGKKTHPNKPWFKTTGAELTTGDGGIVIRSDADRERLYESVKAWDEPLGGTPLYHGLYLACQSAQRFVRENRKVCIVVFSDGQDEKHTNDISKKEDLEPFNNLFNTMEFNACLNWISSEKTSLDKPFGDRFVWLKPSGSKVVIPVVCNVRPRTTFLTLQSPLVAGGAKIEAPFEFSLLPKRWESLLADGVDADYSLKTKDEMTDVGGGRVRISQGATTQEVLFQIDDSHFAGGKAAEFVFSLKLHDDATRGWSFLQPAPMGLSFEKQGAVSLSSVKPDSGRVFKVGEPVTFSAEGTDGATFTWSFGDNTKLNGASVRHSFAASAPNGVSFEVAAEKAGLVPAQPVKGTVIVVESGVKLDPLPTGLKVGDTAVFSCRGKGKIDRYEWFVDGEPLKGEDANDGLSSKLSVPLTKVGDYSIRVRAHMTLLNDFEKDDAKFSVAPAPFAKISHPIPGDRFEAETNVLLVASVEGDFTTGEWNVRDAETGSVVKSIRDQIDDKKSDVRFSAPEEGGEFTVSFVAGEGASSVTAEPITFSVKAKDVRLDVVEKTAPVTTGSSCELKASTKGLAGSVVFFLVDESTGAETRLAEAKILANGDAITSHTFPIEDGAGERTIVAKSSDGKVVSDPVIFRLVTDAGLKLTDPPNNARVPYGGSLVFTAEPSGVVKAKDVKWYLRSIGGNDEKEVGKGASCEHHFKAVQNYKELSYEVYAKAPLPDKSSRETDHRTVTAYCPEILASFEAPPSVAPREEFSVRLKVDAKSAPVKEVMWDFGDGTVETATATKPVSHKYAAETTGTITATAICANCLEEKKFTLQTSVKCPPLAPVTLEASPTVDIGVPASLAVRHAGKASEYRWTFGDGAIETNNEPQISHAFGEARSYSASVVAKCALCGKEFPSDNPATIEVRCPPLLPYIEVQRDESDTDSPFSLGKKIRMDLKFKQGGADARARDIVWTFGDGRTETNSLVVFPDFFEYGTHTISVSVGCSACAAASETASTTITVAKIPAKASFKICRTTSDKPAGSLFGWIPRGSTIALVSTSTGDIKGLRWTCDGEPIPDGEGKDRVEYDCNVAGKHVFALTVFDPDGGTDGPVERSAIVCRFLVFWGLMLAALIASAIIWWLYSGNDPWFWTIRSLIDPTGRTPFAELPWRSARQIKFSANNRETKSPYWSIWKKKARIPFRHLVPQRPALVVWGKGTKAGDAILSVTEFKTDADRRRRRCGLPQYDHNCGSLIEMEVSPDRLYARFRATGVKKSELEFSTLCVNVETKEAGLSFLYRRFFLTVVFFTVALILASRLAF